MDRLIPDYALQYSRHAGQYPHHFTARTRRHSANNMSPHILHRDNSTWKSSFIESRLWEFEIVPAFVHGTDIRRCDNEYALQVFYHLAEHNPQVDNISYRIFNTMQGPIRIQQPLHQPARALMTTCHDLRIKTFSFLHNRQLMHAISARFQRLTQDLTFPVHYPQSTTEWHIKHRMPDELRQILLQREHAFFLSRTVPTLALQTLQLNTFQCQL